LTKFKGFVQRSLSCLSQNWVIFLAFFCLSMQVSVSKSKPQWLYLYSSKIEKLCYNIISCSSLQSCIRIMGLKYSKR
jgi:hypothetical protein